MFQNEFGQKEKFILILYKISDLFLLNILWIVFSIPIFTIGASTAALYTVTLKMSKNEESYIFKSFLHAFRENFRQGVCLWLIYAVTGGVLYFNLYIAASGKLIAQAFFQTIFAIMAILYVLIGIYIFPVLAKYKAGLRQLLKLSIYLSLRHIGDSLIMLAVAAVPVVIAVTDLYLLPVLLIIGISGAAFIASYLLNRIFNKYKNNEMSRSL